MQRAIDEMDRRRIIQMQYNDKHQITPKSIKKSIQEIVVKQDKKNIVSKAQNEEDELILMKNIPKLIKNLESKMNLAAKNLEFEKAAELRDRVKKLREQHLSILI